MQRALQAFAVSAAAVALAGGAARAVAQVRPETPATRPAIDGGQVPVKEVVLFSSGVGYFEHFGSVKGDGAAELNFKSEQINDILKSLLLEDLDGGRVEAVNYPSQDPLAKTLKSFQVDIASNPSLSTLLNQLRGARVTAWGPQGQMEGTVLGVEDAQRPMPLPPGANPATPVQVRQVHVLNLVSGGMIRPVELEQVSEVRLEDPRLQEELNKALGAVAAARDKDKKPVSIRFSGHGERRVRIGYVVETPVWKTSYRLVLSAPGNAPGDAQAPATQPAAGAAATPAQLQGWAIVENQTDNDWNGVELSLVSGRPISFVEDLYQPLYIPRPVVQPELYASLRPQTYEGGLQESAKRLADEQVNDRDAAGNMAHFGSVSGKRQLRGAAPMAAGGEMQMQAAKAMDPTSSVASIASAAKVGELFQYTVGSVSLARQSSAMIPIITSPIHAAKLSIYNESVLARNPLLGARLTNDTGKFLPQGPITVLDGGSYAGDASLEDVPPTQDRLISYGIDQQLLVNADSGNENVSLLTGKIVKGVLHLTFKREAAKKYVAQSKADTSRTLVIEHPLHPGWTLDEPKKADEKTDTLYRFIIPTPPGKQTTLTVREEHVDGQEIAILPMDLGQIELYARTGPIPQAVKDALAKAAQLKQAVADSQRQIDQRRQGLDQLTTEQARLRENMKTVATNSEYYQRLLKKLDAQETQIESIQKEQKSLEEKRDGQQKELEDYLNNLSVE